MTSKLFDNNHQELPLSHDTVTQAWVSINSVDRDLMLFCWAACRVRQGARNIVAHPSTPASDAKILFTKDLVRLSLVMRNRANEVVDESNLFPK